MVYCILAYHIGESIVKDLNLSFSRLLFQSRAMRVSAGLSQHKPDAADQLCSDCFSSFQVCQCLKSTLSPKIARVWKRCTVCSHVVGIINPGLTPSLNGNNQPPGGRAEGFCIFLWSDKKGGILVLLLVIVSVDLYLRLNFCTRFEWIQ